MIVSFTLHYITYNIQPSGTLESRVEVTTLRKASANMSVTRLGTLLKKPCMRDSPRSVTVTHPRTITGLDVA